MGEMTTLMARDGHEFNAWLTAPAGAAHGTNKLNPGRAIMGLLPTTLVGWIAGNRTFGI
jgi:hypothetical protein